MKKMAARRLLAGNASRQHGTARGRHRFSLQPEEKAEFLEAVKDVKPLKTSARVPLQFPRPEPIPKQTQRDEADVLHNLLTHSIDLDVFETGDELLYLRPGLQQHLLRRLRRGHFRLQDHLDLHGMTVPEAKEAMGYFLASALSRRLRCVRIIHGKGLSSPNREPVLKRKVGAWLMQREEVLAFAQAPSAEGGAGAVLVLLIQKK